MKWTADAELFDADLYVSPRSAPPSARRVKLKDVEGSLQEVSPIEGKTW